MIIFILLIYLLLKINDTTFDIIKNFDEFLYLLFDNFFTNYKPKEYIIPKFIKPSNKIPISNNYKIKKEPFDYNDYHIVIYYLEDHKCSIIIRNLYNYNIKKLKILLDNEVIDVPSYNDNVYTFEKITTTKLDKTNIDYDQIIPKLIIQTGKTAKTNNINAIMTFIDLNPEYSYIFFDNNDCISFIKDHFDDTVFHAFNKIKPGAYKADLFRYCVLYVLGGCYFDNKQIDRVALREFIGENQEIFLCLDYNDEEAYYNACMLSSKHNNILKKCIEKCVENINNNYYGKSALEITGPKLLYQQAKINKHNAIHRFKSLYFFNFLRHKGDIYSPKLNKVLISSSYKNYYKYRSDDYFRAWLNHKIY